MPTTEPDPAHPTPVPEGSAHRRGEPDDRWLLAQHVAGDPEAFGTLFARHRDRLWALALRTTGDPEEAADALQDAMIAAFRRAESYRGDAAVTTWLHRIVVNASLDRLRRAKVRRTEVLPEEPDPQSGRATWRSPDSDDPARAAEEDEVRRAVWSALALLVPDQRAALVLVDMEGYSIEEAARILQAPEGTVKSRCSRGRARLHALLSDQRNAGGLSRVPPRTTPPEGGEQ